MDHQWNVEQGFLVSKLLTFGCLAGCVFPPYFQVNKFPFYSIAQWNKATKLLCKCKFFGRQVFFSPSFWDFIFFWTVGYGYKNCSKLLYVFVFTGLPTTQTIAKIGQLDNMKFSLLIFFLTFTSGSAYFCEVCLFVCLFDLGIGLFGHVHKEACSEIPFLLISFKLY